MRILHIIPNLSQGGAERLVLDICNELGLREDLKVKLVTFSSTNNYKLLSKNIDWEVVDISVSLSLYKPSIVDVSSLQCVIDDFRPDIIHSHLYLGELYSRLCNFSRAKWFSHVHDNMVQLKSFSIQTLFQKKLFLNFFERIVLQKRYIENGGTTFITISKHCDKYIGKELPSSKRILLKNAISYQKFYRKRKYPKLFDLKLINVGSLVTKKNQILLLKIVKHLLLDGIEVSLVLLGEGCDRIFLEKYTEENQLEQHVTFTGNVEDVESYLSEANVYIHSALYEPFGLVLLEAMSAGLPVVALDGGGNSDVVINEENGFLIPDNNETLFTNKLKELLRNEMLYQSISESGQEFAANYDISKYADKLIEIYNN